MTNTLYYGDNLAVLREQIADASVDLIYLDPPFNSNAGYNVLFKSTSGAGADASIEAFDDTWTWGEASQHALLDIASGTNRSLTVMMNAMHSAIGENPLMAYLAMMAVRLVELHRVLKPTGSLYLHCDPTASHYLKLVLDAVFGAENFRSEISWKRSSAHNDAKQGRKIYGNIRDVIFFYTKGNDWTFNWQYTPFSEHYKGTAYKGVDSEGRRFRRGDLTAAKPGGNVSYGWRVKRPAGGQWIGDLDDEHLSPRPTWEYKEAFPYNRRYWAYSVGNMRKMESEGRLIYNGNGMPEYKRYLDEMPGVPLQNNWDDIDNAPAQGEYIGYPTQKPVSLLERIIAASSNPGDVVLDPFCGCGTAVDAAQKLGRAWIGIDVTHIAIGMIENRMREGYPGIVFDTIGVPKDLASAERLALDDPHQFQQWICWQVGGFPREKKGGDKGVDGWFNYQWVDPHKQGVHIIDTGVISVKAGDNVNPNMVRDLGRVMVRDGHRFGLFVMKGLPTKGMREEAASHGMVEMAFGGSSAESQRFPALQFVTLAELFQGIRPKLPPLVSPVKKAARVETRVSHKQGAQPTML